MASKKKNVQRALRVTRPMRFFVEVALSEFPCWAFALLWFSRGKENAALSSHELAINFLV
jgi:hypothetical protein